MNDRIDPFNDAPDERTARAVDARYVAAQFAKGVERSHPIVWR